MNLLDTQNSCLILTKGRDATEKCAIENVKTCSIHLLIVVDREISFLAHLWFQILNIFFTHHTQLHPTAEYSRNLCAIIMDCLFNTHTDAVLNEYQINIWIIRSESYEIAFELFHCNITCCIHFFIGAVIIKLNVISSIFPQWHHFHSHFCMYASLNLSFPIKIATVTCIQAMFGAHWIRKTHDSGKFKCCFSCAFQKMNLKNWEPKHAKWNQWKIFSEKNGKTFPN